MNTWKTSFCQIWIYGLRQCDIFYFYHRVWPDYVATVVLLLKDDVISRSFYSIVPFQIIVTVTPLLLTPSSAIFTVLIILALKVKIIIVLMLPPPLPTEKAKKKKNMLSFFLSFILLFLVSTVNNLLCYSLNPCFYFGMNMGRKPKRVVVNFGRWVEVQWHCVFLKSCYSLLIMK